MIKNKRILMLKKSATSEITRVSVRIDSVAGTSLDFPTAPDGVARPTKRLALVVVSVLAVTRPADEVDVAVDVGRVSGYVTIVLVFVNVSLT